MSPWASGGQLAMFISIVSSTNMHQFYLAFKDYISRPIVVSISRYLCNIVIPQYSVLYNRYN